MKSVFLDFKKPILQVFNEILANTFKKIFLGFKSLKICNTIWSCNVFFG